MTQQFYQIFTQKKKKSPQKVYEGVCVGALLVMTKGKKCPKSRKTDQKVNTNSPSAGNKRELEQTRLMRMLQFFGL